MVEGVLELLVVLGVLVVEALELLAIIREPQEPQTWAVEVVVADAKIILLAQVAMAAPAS